jgi:hypothetical protein
LVVGQWKATFGVMVLCGAVCPQAYASAWNPDPWHGEIISGYVFATADEAIGDFGDRVQLDIYNKKIVQTYGNMGLTPKIALIGTFDWQDTQIVGPGLDTAFSKPSSMSAGLQYQISRREGHATAVSLSYIDGIDLPNALLTLESREPSVELRALWDESRPVYGRNVFAEAQMAARMTTGGTYASSHMQFTVGGEPLPRILLLAKTRYTNVEPGVFERLDIVRQTRWEVEASAVYRLREKDYVEIGYSTVLGGQSAVLESGWKIGLWRKF